MSAQDGVAMVQPHLQKLLPWASGLPSLGQDYPFFRAVSLLMKQAHSPHQALPKDTLAPCVLCHLL